jgi:hypothetical protein
MASLQNIYKLSTKEDEYHIHKSLGTFCLANFIYRFYLLFACGSMRLNTPFGLYSVIVHGILSISSLQFHISNTRNPSKPMIYPEFRMHSILFGLRSVIITILYHFEWDYKYIIAICYSVLFLSEYITKITSGITKIYGKNEDNKTMRNMPFDPSISEENKSRITKMHSIMQIGATIFMLGNINSAFSPLFAIQTAAFLMTLVRKSIITTNTWHLCYTIGLFMNYLLFPTFSPSFIIFLAFVINIHERIVFPYKINKYIAWTFHFGLFIILREYSYEIWIDHFFMKRYYIWWFLIKLWMLGKMISFEKYLKYLI